jgi:hypothetical protein
MLLKIKRGKGNWGGVDSVGELKEVVRRFILASSKHE